MLCLTIFLLFWFTFWITPWPSCIVSICVLTSACPTTLKSALHFLFCSLDFALYLDPSLLDLMTRGLLLQHPLSVRLEYGEKPESIFCLPCLIATTIKFYVGTSKNIKALHSSTAIFTLLASGYQ
ncbi:hypothetical protein PGIGA_G00038340 [Pangasianodon gigas]|uniref:Uncharacterized protein n=1 Tax=Pangasianodon gigas TaxID=30993 RepID=A0ACC5X0H2_PANGG|nr:hypothetical protein [Pangasianodon gigas]